MSTTPPPLIDIGANLSHESFSHDLDAVLDRARAAGVGHIVLTGTSLQSSEQALQMARGNSSYLSSTAGLHPHEAADFSVLTEQALEELAQAPEVRAIGETGLDFNRNYSPPAAQEAAFHAQLAIAVTTGKPAFLHQRDAHKRFLPILKEYRDKLSRAVVHCFTGSREELYDYLDLDLYIGITGWICDERRGTGLHPLVREIPEQRLMLETDAPYLLPRSIRPKPASRRNEPANLRYVLAMVAECAGTDTESMAARTTNNAKDFFGL